MWCDTPAFLLLCQWSVFSLIVSLRAAKHNLVRVVVVASGFLFPSLQAAEEKLYKVASMDIFDKCSLTMDKTAFVQDKFLQTVAKSSLFLYGPGSVRFSRLRSRGQDTVQQLWFPDSASTHATKYCWTSIKLTSLLTNNLSAAKRTPWSICRGRSSVLCRFDVPQPPTGPARKPCGISRSWNTGLTPLPFTL